MKFLKYITLSALAAAFASTAAFADDKEEKPERKKGGDPAARFAKLDTDKDDKLTVDELKAGMKKNPEMAEKMMKAKDKDKDGKLTKEEFTAKPTRKKGGEGKKKKGAE